MKRSACLVVLYALQSIGTRTVPVNEWFSESHDGSNGSGGGGTYEWILLQAILIQLADEADTVRVNSDTPQLSSAAQAFMVHCATYVSVNRYTLC